MAEMKILYVRSSDQPVASGKAVKAAIEFTGKDDVRVLINRIVENGYNEKMEFESYSYYEASRLTGSGHPEQFRVLELTVSVPEDCVLGKAALSLQKFLL